MDSLARMAELVDAQDLKSCSFGSPSSILGPGTIFGVWRHGQVVKAEVCKTFIVGSIPTAASNLV